MAVEVLKEKITIKDSANGTILLVGTTLEVERLHPYTLGLGTGGQMSW